MGSDLIARSHIVEDNAWDPEKGASDVRVMQLVQKMVAFAIMMNTVAHGSERSDVLVMPVGSGVVINHIPKSTGIYIGSPSITQLADGTLVATHDEFGPNSSQNTSATTRVFRSTDNGDTWEPGAVLRDQFWSNLFQHDGAIYLMGTTKNYGRMVIRRSLDGGLTWTTPTDTTNGYLSLPSDNRYHTAPMPVVEHNGRLWRGYENTPGAWGTFESFVMSAPVNGDLLNMETWTQTNRISRSTSWLPGNSFYGWLEGGIVVNPQDELVNMLRVHRQLNGGIEHMAITHVQDENTHTFNPATDIHEFSGGAKKFVIRQDAVTGRYITLANIVNEDNADPSVRTNDIRNTLALKSSEDLVNWTVDAIVVQDLTDRATMGFQYADWIFDGDDILAVVRTAYPDAFGSANNYHDANYLTFHRVENFRALIPEPASLVLLGVGAPWLLRRRRA